VSKANKTGRSKGEGRYIALRHWLYDSQAFRSLSAGARGVYLMLQRRYAGPGSNNGSIPLSIREVADEFHVGKSTAHGYFIELQERGFVEVVIRGTFTRKDRRATEWRLTEYPCDLTDDMPSKLFMRWQPGNNFTVRPQVRSVPVGEPDGTCRRTVLMKKVAHGT
jgi:hypothetical protein